MCCRSLDERPGEEPMAPNEGGPVPLTRVKALVSMMTPRDYRVGAAPPFIEFDMSVEGFGYALVYFAAVDRAISESHFS